MIDEKYIRDLESEIKSAAQDYYTDGSSELTDEEFDSKVDELKQLYPESNLFKTGWGYNVFKDTTPGQKYHHLYGVAGSLDKVRFWDEMPGRMKTDTKINKSICVDLSLKLDGLSCVLYYENNILYRALTRGDGEIGIDVTNKVKKIDNGYYSVINRNTPEYFSGAIRGELLMSYENYDKYHILHPESKNPRNSAAGIINGKNTDEDLKYLSLVCYTIVGLEDSKYDNLEISDIRAALEEMLDRDHVVEHSFTGYLHEEDLDDVMKKYRGWWYGKYPADGIVITGNDVRVKNKEVIYNAVAFKFEAESKVTTVRNIEWTLSKNNKLIPVFVVDPVELSGSTVERASGYNAQYIKDVGLGVGSIVKITKMNEIIPKINQIIEAHGSVLPSTCPSCGGPLEWDGVDLRCNNPDCENIKKQDTIWFMKQASPVDGLSDKLIDSNLENLRSQEVIKDITVEDIMECTTKLIETSSAQYNLFVKSWNNLHDPAVKLDFSQALLSLNIERLGDLTVKKLNNIKCKNHLVRLMTAMKDNGLNTDEVNSSKYEIQKIVGPATLESILNSRKRFLRLSYLLDKINTLPETETKGEVAITGKLSMPRNKFEELLKLNGWELGDLKKKTKFLITDDPNSNSSKNKKADQWSIPKITEKEFTEQYLSVKEQRSEPQKPVETKKSGVRKLF